MVGLFHGFMCDICSFNSFIISVVQTTSMLLFRVPKKDNLLTVICLRKMLQWVNILPFELFVNTPSSTISTRFIHRLF